jgi:hypothetical protein
VQGVDGDEQEDPEVGLWRAAIVAGTVGTVILTAAPNNVFR